MYVTAIIPVSPVYIFTDLYELCRDYEFACGDGACIDHVCDGYQCGIAQLTPVYVIYRSS